MRTTTESRAVWGIILSGALLLAVCVTPPRGEAQGPPYGGGSRGPGGGGGLMLPVLLRSANLTPDQQSQVRSILAARRTSARSIIQQLRQAQAELADKLVAPGPAQMADIQPQLQKISQLRDQLLQNGAQATLDIRALLTADQLTAAGQAKDRLRQLRSEMQQILGRGQP